MTLRGKTLMTDIIKIDNLVFDYGSDDVNGQAERAINGVSLDVMQGSFVAVIGRAEIGRASCRERV